MLEIDSATGRRYAGFLDGIVRGQEVITYTLNSERERSLARAMVDMMPTGTIVTFTVPPLPTEQPKPPVDYAMVNEPWEQVA